MVPTRPNLIQFCISILLVLSAIASVDSKNIWGKVSNEEWALTAPPAYPDVDVMVLMDVCTLHVEASGIVCQRYARLKVLKKSGADKLNTFGFLRDEDDKTREFKAQRILPNGDVVKVDKTSIQRQKSKNGEKLSAIFPAAEPGCIVEMKYIGAHERFWLLEPWYFQGDYYTRVSSITLVLAPGFVYSTLFSAVPRDFQSPTQDEQSNIDDPVHPYKLYTYARTDLPPADKDEPYSGFVDEYRSSLFCQLVKYDWNSTYIDFSRSWQSLGNDFQKYWVEPYLTAGDLRSIVDSVVPSNSSNLETARKLYKYVVDATTLVSSTWGGTGSCNHKNLGKFMESHAGNADDINLLYVALLREAGIGANFVLVPSRLETSLVTRVPIAWQFSSSLVLAEIDSLSYVFDPANKWCIPGKISPRFLGQDALVIDGKSSNLITIPESQERSYRLDATDIFIDSSGRAICSSVISMTGNFPPYYGRTTVQTDSEWVNTMITNSVQKDLNPENWNYELNDDGKLTCWATYKVDNRSRTIDNNLFVKPIALRFTNNPFSAEKRTFPIDFQFPCTWHNISTIRFISEPKEMTLPQDIAVEIGGMTFDRKCRREGASAIVDSKLVIIQPLFDMTAYVDIKRLFELIAAASTDEVGVSF